MELIARKRFLETPSRPRSQKIVQSHFPAELDAERAWDISSIKSAGDSFRQARRTPVVPTSRPVINFALNFPDLLPCRQDCPTGPGPMEAPRLSLLLLTCRIVRVLASIFAASRPRAAFQSPDASLARVRRPRARTRAHIRAERISSGTAAPEIEEIALARGVAINSIESRCISKIKARYRSARAAYLTRSIPLSTATLKALSRCPPSLGYIINRSISTHKNKEYMIWSSDNYIMIQKNLNCIKKTFIAIML